MDSRLKFRMWFKYGLKAQKLLAQGNGHKQHALKGQKLLAQGITLGVVAISKAPCKGKSFVNYLILKAFALTGRQVCVHKHPGRCPGLRASAPSGRVGQNLRNFGGAKLRITLQLLQGVLGNSNRTVRKL